MKKILVVDDSALMRRVLCDIIEQDKRFQVVEKATNGLEALELLKKNTYDAVVLDVNMPKMSGLELLKELQKNKIAARISIERIIQVVSWSSFMGMVFCPDKRTVPSKPAIAIPAIIRGDRVSFLLCDFAVRKAIPSIKSRTIQTAAIDPFDHISRKRSD